MPVCSQDEEANWLWLTVHWLQDSALTVFSACCMLFASCCCRSGWLQGRQYRRQVTPGPKGMHTRPENLPFVTCRRLLQHELSPHGYRWTQEARKDVVA